jgi:CDP-glycerol glycerophosphotransferase (TagB/SpsB family)
VILMSDRSVGGPVTDGPKTRRVRKNSLAGVFWFLTARYVFFSHRCFVDRFPDDVVSVNVWHGMPIKRIGWLLEGDSGIECGVTPVTSPFWREIMSKAMKPGGVLPDVGLPRNDRLFREPGAVMGKLGFGSHAKVVVWLPTYRRSVRGLVRSDGRGNDDVFGLPGLDVDELNLWLAERGAVLVVKAHPMAAFTPGAWSHVKVADDEWLRSRKTSLYELLGASCCLISDISSVVVDYLLLDRPVIHVFPDLEDYRENRGFTVGDVADCFAGPVAGCAGELFEALEGVLAGKDPDGGRRKLRIERWHTHRDAGSTRRLLEAVGLECG